MSKYLIFSAKYCGFMIIPKASLPFVRSLWSSLIETAARIAPLSAGGSEVKSIDHTPHPKEGEGVV